MSDKYEYEEDFENDRSRNAVSTVFPIYDEDYDKDLTARDADSQLGSGLGIFEDLSDSDAENFTEKAGKGDLDVDLGYELPGSVGNYISDSFDDESTSRGT